MNSDQFKKVIWDYNLSKKEFEEILSGKKTIGKMDKFWAMARVLENLNYYDAMGFLSLNTLKNNWDNIKNRIFNSTIKKGYEFILYKYTLPITG